MEEFKSKRKIIFTLIKNLIIGLGLLIFGFYFWESLAGNPYHEYLLLKNGITTTGYIIDATPDANSNDQGRTAYSYFYEYAFTTANGKKITSHGSDDGRMPDELYDLKTPYALQVVYLSSNPEINKIKNKLPSSFSDWFWRKVCLGTVILLFCLSFGFLAIRYGIKEYLTAIKKYNIDLEKWNKLYEQRKLASMLIDSLVCVTNKRHHVSKSVNVK